MKAHLLFTFILLSICISAKAQSKATMEKLEAARIALITERLELSPEQAEKFWPIYREFSEQRRTLRKEFQQMRKNHDPRTATEEENQKLLASGMKIKERQLQLEQTYTERMQKVISTRQIMSLRKAEDDFKDMLLRRIRQEQQQRRQMRDNQQRNQEHMRRKRDQ
ncbi:Spy/CpxP family protein refolding chaperone [Marinoscillum furvescens]|uniref:LTXXQ motif family protein n=1 Tax=Marinoscillum furvescens DSM 4134 TaxID=1122208 RepID=A0A3D9L354_MARFU|nr:hypothetical protein [Marinoscillum furvescens]RED96212.1 hypothetical protein C7460_115103 [Marinoscillum furvescens DSM 4134]